LRLPRFTAEAALRETGERYQGVAIPAAWAQTRVAPAQVIRPCTKCVCITTMVLDGSLVAHEVVHCHTEPC